MGGADLTMGEFIYLTSLDHAKWFIPDVTTGIEIGKEVLESRRGKQFEIRRWIEHNCKGRVWMWNKVDAPALGQQDWGDMIAPQGNGVFFFEDEEDRILFYLTWA